MGLFEIRRLGFDRYFIVVRDTLKSSVGVVRLGSPTKALEPHPAAFSLGFCVGINLLVFREIDIRTSTLPEHPYLFWGSRREIN